MIPNQFETEVAQELEKLFVDFKHKVAKFTGDLNKYLSESTSGAQREFGNCVTMLSNHVASVREASSLQPSAIELNTSLAAAGTALSTTVVSNSE